MRSRWAEGQRRPGEENEVIAGQMATMTGGNSNMAGPKSRESAQHILHNTSLFAGAELRIKKLIVF